MSPMCFIDILSPFQEIKCLFDCTVFIFSRVMSYNITCILRFFCNLEFFLSCLQYCHHPENVLLKLCQWAPYPYLYSKSGSHISFWACGSWRLVWWKAGSQRRLYSWCCSSCFLCLTWVAANSKYVTRLHRNMILCFLTTVWRLKQIDSQQSVTQAFFKTMFLHRHQRQKTEAVKVIFNITYFKSHRRC